MKNGKPEREKTIILERAESDGYWTATVLTPDGPIVGVGESSELARFALDLLLQKRDRAHDE